MTHYHFEWLGSRTGRCTEFLADGTQCGDFKDHPTRSHRHPVTVWAWKITGGHEVERAYRGDFGPVPATFTWEGDVSAKFSVTEQRPEQAAFREAVISAHMLEYGRLFCTAKWCIEPSFAPQEEQWYDADHINEYAKTHNNCPENGRVVHTACHRLRINNT